MGMQSVGDKKNEKVIQNRLNFFIDGNLVHPCTFSTFSLYT